MARNKRQWKIVMFEGGYSWEIPTNAEKLMKERRVLFPDDFVRDVCTRKTHEYGDKVQSVPIRVCVSKTPFNEPKSYPDEFLSHLREILY